MAGRNKQELVVPTNSLVASAVRYSGKVARIYTPNTDWQRECYRHFHICGEARYAANFYGNALSRCVMKVARMGSSGREEVTSGPAVDVLNDMFNGKEGQAQMLKALGIHLTVAGECYIVGRDAQPDEENDLDVDLEDGAQIWEVVSINEMKVTGKKWAIHYSNRTKDVDLTDEDVVIRVWIPSPDNKMEADSPFRSLLPILGEIEWITLHIYSQLQSRLSGNGILFLPQGITFPPPPDVDGQPAAVMNDAQGFMLTLGDAMLTPLKDPGSPSARIPVVAMVPDDMTDKPHWQTFWSELDSAAMEMRREAVQRFAVGMDLPPERVVGMSSNGGTGGGNSNGVSHWGAWQIEEDTIKMHVEPTGDTICNAITVGYLRPAGVASEFIYLDTSALRLRPDRSKEAIELFNLGALSVKAMLRENGFHEDDAPDEAELKLFFLRKIATGSATPEMVNSALRALGIKLEPLPEFHYPEDERPNEARPAPSLEDHPTRPRTPGENMALLSASEALVFRALERAGNRLRASGGKPIGVPSYETHTLVKVNGNAEYLLDDAWSCAPQVLDGIADPGAVTTVLSAYVRNLFATQQPHSRQLLNEWLKRGVSA